jgi:2-methylisocitrate lyase-like PEP mutase family enzyme
MSKPTVPIPAATKLRAMLAEKDKVVVAPGVYDGLTTRIALETGFDCLYMVAKPSLKPVMVD